MYGMQEENSGSIQAALLVVDVEDLIDKMMKRLCIRDQKKNEKNRADIENDTQEEYLDEAGLSPEHRLFLEHFKELWRDD